LEKRNEKKESDSFCQANGRCESESKKRSPRCGSKYAAKE